MAVSNVKIDKDLPIKEIEYAVPSERQRHLTRLDYEHNFRKTFLEYIAENERENLKASGLWDTLIDRTLARGKTPPGWGVHHKTPIHGGGQNTMENVIFIRFSEHFQIHRYIDNFIEGMSEGDSKKIKIPYPEGFVHVPKDKNDNFSIQKHEESPEERKARIEKNRREKRKEYHDRINKH